LFAGSYKEIFFHPLPQRKGKEDLQAPLVVAEIIPKQVAAVLVLVAVKAEILPIRAIRRIILRISIFVVHR